MRTGDIFGAGVGVGVGVRGSFLGAGCTTGMWSSAAVVPTAALGGSILFAVISAIDIKGARGTQHKARLGRAVVSKCASALCILWVLPHVQLAIEQSLFTIFELTCTVVAGVILYGESVGLLKGAGMVLAVIGIVLLSEPARPTARDAKAAVQDCEVIVNTPVLGIVFCLLMLLSWQLGRQPVVLQQLLAAHAKGSAPHGQPRSSYARAVKEAAASDQDSAIATTPRMLRLAWAGFWLVVTAVLEIWVAFFLKEAQGFSGKKEIMSACLLASMSTITCAVALETGTLSASWTVEAALEYVGVVLMAILVFGEPLDSRRAAGMGISMVGCLVLAGLED